MYEHFILIFSNFTLYKRKNLKLFFTYILHLFFIFFYHYLVCVCVCVCVCNKK